RTLLIKLVNALAELLNRQNLFPSIGWRRLQAAFSSVPPRPVEVCSTSTSTAGFRKAVQQNRSGTTY
ncbi:MAG: hypothetical protein P8N76_04840, partial [Pirellulaceae bacterium]|nr:hypothetical protein [Pirellulaceae bacterium]